MLRNAHYQFLESFVLPSDLCNFAVEGVVENADNGLLLDLASE